MYVYCVCVPTELSMRLQQCAHTCTCIHVHVHQSIFGPIFHVHVHVHVHVCVHREIQIPILVSPDNLGSANIVTVIQTCLKWVSPMLSFTCM